MCSGCLVVCVVFFSSRRRHTRCALVTGVQTCALPICFAEGVMWILAALINTGQGVIHQRHCRPRRALRFALALHVVVCLSSPGDVEKNLVFVIALHTVVAIAFASLNAKPCSPLPCKCL